MVRKDEDFKFEGRPYLDIVDGHNLGHLAKKHPEVKVIVCSKIDMETMAGAIPNDIIFIPQHHCNFKRIKRRRKQITTVGVIGTRGAFPLLPSGLEEALKERQIQLIKFSRFFSRKDIVDFYKRIDVQLVWRPYKKILSNPLKLVNAMSFGIPTIALDEDAFQEIDITGITLPITKHNYLVRDASSLARIVKEAFYIARNGRPGPVLIDIPGDVFAELAEFSYPSRVNLPGYKLTLQGHPTQISKAANMINEAQKPLIIAGQGAMSSGGNGELKKLAETAQIPVITTLLGLGSFL